jgi:DnaJ-class molecular chaperone
MRRKGKPVDGVFERFSQVYGAAARPPREKRQETSKPPPTPERLNHGDTAFSILGVAPGASREQIGAAYRKLARLHHPDKVANESLEVREASERRMKEINAAYALLKHPGNGSSTTEAQAG